MGSLYAEKYAIKVMQRIYITRACSFTDHVDMVKEEKNRGYSAWLQNFNENITTKHFTRTEYAKLVVTDLGYKGTEITTINALCNLNS